MLYLSQWKLRKGNEKWFDFFANLTLGKAQKRLNIVLRRLSTETKNHGTSIYVPESRHGQSRANQ